MDCEHKLTTSVTTTVTNVDGKTYKITRIVCVCGAVLSTEAEEV